MSKKLSLVNTSASSLKEVWECFIIVYQFLLNFLERCDSIFLRRNSIRINHRECVFTLVKMHSPFCVLCGC